MSIGEKYSVFFKLFRDQMFKMGEVEDLKSIDHHYAICFGMLTLARQLEMLDVQENVDTYSICLNNLDKLYITTIEEQEEALIDTLWNA